MAERNLPAFILLGPCVVGLVAANLLVESVEELLAGGCSGEGGAIEECAAETAEIEQTLGGCG